MSQRSVRVFILLFFAVHWAAVVLRVDRFPLTWAPMYSTFTPSETLSVRVVDKERMRRGLAVTRADGTSDWVDWDDLNIPKWNFWRLYYQRMRGRGPIKHRQADMNLSSFNRAVRGLDDGEQRFPEVDWPRRLMRSVNHTLGLEPGDTDFIVRIEVVQERRRYRVSDLSDSWSEEFVYVVEWDDAWADGWGDGAL